ncbi:aminotransferase-like domain-containing protein [Magnetospirillum molischianum]|uniref:aminotransferase-like domain-containing protein n=1 Tax=Magnetospirillum molischianum TaxID=1083 RepID=UPI001F2766ED|nr:PLP-dependent aminotransferase family protein [Magnetospirillum molischianum]
MTADSWISDIDMDHGPLYLAIADALEAGIRSGKLGNGFRLPPQRSLAKDLGIDFTTVTRAYAEARKRGLVEGKVGLGTYIRVEMSHTMPTRARPLPDEARRGGVVDMSMNLPPRFDDPDLTKTMRQSLARIDGDGGLSLLMRYQEPGGTHADRMAGAHYLSARIPGLTADRVLVCPGAQGAFLAIAGMLLNQGDAVCTEALTYPGFRSLASHMKMRLLPVEMDAEGMRPDSFEALCKSAAPKALYCTPTLHNPTTATMSLSRREDVLAIARTYAVPIIEDDAYGALPYTPIPPLAALAPDMVYHVASLSKALSPALRVAYVVPPDSRQVPRLVGAIRALTSMTSPITAALAREWIENGTAVRILEAIRQETAARQQIARETLPPGCFSSDPEGFHLWLRLEAPWSRGEFVDRLRGSGIGTVPSDPFAVQTPPECVRLGLGAATTRADLTQSLLSVRDLLTTLPSLSSMVI